MKEKESNGVEEKRVLTDCLLIAYLAIDEKFTVKPIEEGKMVSFEVSGSGLDEAVKRYYENPKVPILTFCQHYKTIRSALFNMRKGGVFAKTNKTERFNWKEQ